MEDLLREGQRHYRAGEYGYAASVLKRVLAIWPRSAEAHNELGAAYLGQGRAVDAEKCFRRALEIDPARVEALCNLGIVLGQAGHVEQAIASLEKALSINPDYLPAYHNLAITLSREGQSEDAMCRLQEAIAFDPDCAETYFSMGLVYQDQGHAVQAIENYRRALEIEPGLVEALHNCGRLLRDRGDLAEALEYFDKAVALRAASPDLRFDRALGLLQVGNLGEGWREYEQRRFTTAAPVSYQLPLWDGSSLEGRSILVCAEQGIGDELRFGSCLPDLIAQAGRCVIECDLRLEEMYRRSFPDAVVHGRSRNQDSSWLSEVPPVEVEVPVGSLALHFRPDLERFPEHRGYVRADSGQVSFWRSRLSQLGDGPKVGVAWRSSLQSVERDVHFAGFREHWGGILGSPGVHFVNLQYDDCADELRYAREAWGVEVHNWEELDQFNDIEGVAALMSALDLVIAGPTVVSQLAGALGRPVWLLAVAHHMVLLGTDSCPWFPQMRVFSQSRHGEWGPVFAAVAHELRGLET